MRFRYSLIPNPFAIKFSYSNTVGFGYELVWKSAQLCCKKARGGRGEGGGVTGRNDRE